jgi:hypothetical protein
VKSRAARDGQRERERERERERVQAGQPSWVKDVARALVGGEFSLMETQSWV